MTVKAQVAVCRYWSVNNQAARFQQWTEAFMPLWDHSMKVTVEAMFESGVSQASFGVTHKHELDLFADPKD